MKQQLELVRHVHFADGETSAAPLNPRLLAPGGWPCVCSVRLDARAWLS